MSPRKSSDVTYLTNHTKKKTEGVSQNAVVTAVTQEAKAKKVQKKVNQTLATEPIQVK